MRQTSWCLAVLLALGSSVSALSDRPLREIHCELRQIPHEEVHPTETNDGEFSLDSIQVGATAPKITQDQTYIWSGYAAIKPLGAKPLYDGRSTGVSGTWTVPTLLPSTNNSSVSIWVGIDGYQTSTVEQIGTAHKWTKGKQQDYAWYEMYPRFANEIVGFPVEPGDEISAKVTYIRYNSFQLEIANLTQGVKTVVPLERTTVTASTVRRAVSWVVEAPFAGKNKTNPIANFQTITFKDCTATIDGVTAGLVNPAWSTAAITMVDNGVVNMVPSAPSADGSSFQVIWKKE